jgi:hypothetical protein
MASILGPVRMRRLRLLRRATDEKFRRRAEAARQALAQARAPDEVKAIRDKAEAIRTYARHTKNKQLEVDAAELRFRAERRLSEMMN